MKMEAIKIHNIYEINYRAEVAASKTIFEVLGLGLGLESQVLGLGLEPSKSSKIGRSSVEDSSFLLPFKSYISLKLF